MIFITGATGFLGSHLLYNLVMLDRPVRALYRNRDKLAFVEKVFQYYQPDAGRLMERIEWVQGDIMDYYTLSEYLKGADQVYHCAGVVSFNPADKQKLFDINVLGTANVVNACLEQNNTRLCHVSSISALGDSLDADPIDENSLWNQGSSASQYSFCKFKGEMEVWRGIHEGLNAVIVNPSVIIGPGIWLGPISSLYQQIFKGLKYYPTGASGYVDVLDVVRMMIRLADSDINGERFIISAENKTHREIINYLAEAMDRPLPTQALTPFLINVLSKLEKLRTWVTGKPPRISRKSMQSATAITSYSNQKILETFSFDFIPVKESAVFSSHLFKDELAGGINLLNLRKSTTGN
jgi:dihydroflavonol-4-reductase